MRFRFDYIGFNEDRVKNQCANEWLRGRGLVQFCDERQSGKYGQQMAIYYQEMSKIVNCPLDTFNKWQNTIKKWAK